MPVKTFEVKGTRYYEAKAEVAATRAREKSEIKFERDPANQYDSNAVRVLLAQNGAFLGHVPQTISAQVSAQIRVGAVKKAYIRSITRNLDYLEIKVTYEFDGPVEQPTKPKIPPVHVAPQQSFVPAPPAPRRLTQPVTPPAQSGAPRPFNIDHYVEPSSQPGGGGREFSWGYVLLAIGGIIVLLMIL